jgi:amino acid adenylation domain-containing protein
MNTSQLTVAQQGIWYLCQSEDAASAAYNMVFAFATSKQVDVGLLQSSVQHVSRRHELLRASITVQAGVPRLGIPDATDAPPVPVAVVRDTLQNLALAESSRPFDLSVAPLMRVTVVQPEAGAHGGVVVALPHIIFDGVSADIFLEELAAVSVAQAAGRDPCLSEAPASAAEIVREESGFCGSSEGREALQKTLARLAGIPSRLALPTRSHVASRSSAVSCAQKEEFWLSQEMVARVNSASQVLRVSSVAFHLAAFSILVRRFTGQGDFGICIPVSNRQTPATMTAIGYLTNLAIVRARISPRARVTNVFADIQDQLFDLMEASGLPYPLVAKGMKRVGENIQGPLQQIGFGYSVAMPRAMQLADQVLEYAEFAPRFAKNELKLDLQETSEGLRGWLLYDSDLFDAELIARMGAAYRQMVEALLDAIAAGLNPGIDELPVLPAADEEQLLLHWNCVSATATSDAGLHDLFDDRAAISPDAVAVTCQGRSLTYRELDARANQVAHALREMGVGPDVLVGICLERSLEMVVGLLAILKAGGAYVPLDPGHPAQRLGQMLHDSRALVLLTTESLLSALPPHDAQVLVVDATNERIARQPTTKLTTVSRAEHLAYCLFTSGSTGRPKGVALSHANATAFLTWARQAFGKELSGSVLFATSICFDLSIFELFGTLSAGGTVVLVPSALALVDAAADVDVDLINTVPSAAKALIESNRLGKRLAVLNLAGEPLPRKLARAIHETCPDVRLFNLYGPTEYTTYATFCEIKRGDDGPVSIGRPLSNTSVYLLDENLRLVPIGASGEVCIAGDGLARGYVNRPDLTAERFVPNPYGQPGSRMYRTGDRARWLPTGEMEFLGRIDDQVKIRGFRIELGEVEAALARCPGVREAIVMAGNDEDPRLVAYVAVGNDKSVTVDDLRACLRKTLPDYMVPSAWVSLDSFPLNPNGKIDRTALCAMQADTAEQAEKFVLPRTPTETLLATIWRDVLKVEQISVTDNFFSLGGHSLLATQIASRLRAQGHKTIPLRRLFDHPSIAELAASIDADS